MVQNANYNLTQDEMDKITQDVYQGIYDKFKRTEFLKPFLMKEYLEQRSNINLYGIGGGLAGRLRKERILKSLVSSTMGFKPANLDGYKLDSTGSIAVPDRFNQDWTDAFMKKYKKASRRAEREKTLNANPSDKTLQEEVEKQKVLDMVIAKTKTAREILWSKTYAAAILNQDALEIGQCDKEDMKPYDLRTYHTFAPSQCHDYKDRLDKAIADLQALRDKHFDLAEMYGILRTLQIKNLRISQLAKNFKPPLDLSDNVQYTMFDLANLASTKVDLMEYATSVLEAANSQLAKAVAMDYTLLADQEYGRQKGEETYKKLTQDDQELLQFICAGRNR